MDYTINKSRKEDKKISIAIMSSFAILTIQYLVLIYFNLIDTNIGQVIQLTSKGLVGFLYLLALPAVLKRNKIKFLGVYFIWIFIFIFNYAFFNENWIYLKSIIFPLFFTGLPSFIYAYSINDWDVLMGVMKKTSNIVFIVGTIIGILVFTNKASIGFYSMSLSYYMLLPAVISLYNFFKYKQLRSFFILLVSFIIIITLGARGPIMCLGLFIICYLIKNRPRTSYNNLLLVFILMVAFIFVLINLDSIILKLYNCFSKIGIRSRTLQIFLEDKISVSSSRNNLYKEIWHRIQENPGFGIGLAGDRFYTGMYTHNIFLEILSGFGIIVGSFIILLLLLVCYKIFKIKDRRSLNLLIVWISIGLAPLLVSGTYLTYYQFWIFLGLSLKLYK